jgi:hypothetical protein
VTTAEQSQDVSKAVEKARIARTMNRLYWRWRLFWGW